MKDRRGGGGGCKRGRVRKKGGREVQQKVFNGAFDNQEVQNSPNYDMCAFVCLLYMCVRLLYACI